VSSHAARKGAILENGMLFSFPILNFLGLIAFISPPSRSLLRAKNTLVVTIVLD
jgi:hypothetical protein